MSEVHGDAQLNPSSVVKHKPTFFSEEESRLSSHLTYTPEFNMNPLSVLCKVINPASKKSLVIRAIFDNCSSVTILRRSIAEKLELSGKKVDLSFTTTGNSGQFYKDQLEVICVLRALDDSYESDPIQAVTLKTLSRQFRRPRLNVAQFPYLSMIDDFTEDYNAEPQHPIIDMLIGNPYSIILGHEEKIIGPTIGSPMAVKTKLGSCLSVNLSSQSTGVTRDEQILHTTVSEEATKRAPPSRATSATEVHPAMVKDVITSTATTETGPGLHEATKGNVSTTETGPGPHEATKGNVSTTETAPGPH